MSRRLILALVCLSSVILFFTQTTSARLSIKVNEAETRCFLKQLAPEFSLAVVNSEPTDADVTIKLELIDPDNQVLGVTERRVQLKPGSQKIPFALPLKARRLSPDQDKTALWNRLRYSISSQTDNNSKLADGLISLSEITPDFFEVQVISPAYVLDSTRYEARVLARHPVSFRPAERVNVEGVITVDDPGKTTLTNSAVTNRDGYAVLKFDLPKRIDSSSIELEVEAYRDQIAVSADNDISVFKVPYPIVSTDKPLYQPGQVVHSRILLLSAARRAIADKLLKFEISDPDDTVVHSANIKTSRFGIATTDWSIPANTRLGDYKVEFSDEQDGVLTSRRIKISRYDLPTFTVNVKTDRSYYLPGQNANVEVNAEYLFGKPVLQGHVRVVRETERRWNYQEQKYDIEQGDKYEADVTGGASFTAHLNLKPDHDELGDEDYSRYKDLSYAAYFTDASTNRTEQRRFNIRVTRDPIHVYVVHPGDRYAEDSRLPLRFYVSTFYADGQPASCTVTINKGDKESQPQFLTKVKTNSYGVARVDQLQIGFQPDYTDVDLQLLVEDRQGRTAKRSHSFTIRNQASIQVTTNKTLFKPGEPITVNVTSNESNIPITVLVCRELDVIQTETVRLRTKRATLLIPYRNEFKDQLIIHAYADVGAERPAFDDHSIMYPRKRDLNLTIQAQKSYKPGEQAQVSFEARDPGGRSIESALGVVVVDKAVEERFRTETEFGREYCDFYREIQSFLGYGDGLSLITTKALDKSTTRQFPADLDLAAEFLLNQSGGYAADVFENDTYNKDLRQIFLPTISRQLKSLEQGLNQTYAKARKYPKNDRELRTHLQAVLIDFDEFKDPWGVGYQPSFSIDRDTHVMTLRSSGPDKRFATDDDFVAMEMRWQYFRPIGEAIDKVVREYHVRTGAFIRDLKVLRDELKRKGIDPDVLRDPWSNPYTVRFEVNRRQFVISVWSVVPGEEKKGEEFQLWSAAIDYFAEPRGKIDSILVSNVQTFPGTNDELQRVLNSAGFDLTKLQDPWGRSYYSTFSQVSFYGDRVSVEQRAIYGKPASQHTQITPVTKLLKKIALRSAGEDLKQGTDDDFDVAVFSATIGEQSATDQEPTKPKLTTTFIGLTGAITGVVTDPNGAVVVNATVTAVRENSEQTLDSTTDQYGRFILRNLPAGIYELRVDAMGFKRAVITSILVRSSQMVEVDVTLDVGAATETVSVVSSSEASQTQASVATTVSKSRLILIAPNLAAAKQQLFTPRLREYFPETLLWQPELTTDKKGRAQLDFKLADNITTWKLSVIGSTENGELGTAETEFRAFQPFFAELDPPRVLTEGDRISLPVVLRNYLEKQQSVDLQLSPANWFKSFDPTRKQVIVSAGNSSTTSFDIQAITSVVDGKQQVTAIGSDSSDAIVKPVSVHPDGEERAETVSALLNDSASLTMNLPADTIANSTRVELKVYPNLMAHVAESVEGIMQRPYGCGEQTISSSYPSLLVLRYLKDSRENTVTVEKARRYLEDGYQRLLGYQSSDGGFTYWGRGTSDVALTAYALRFLNEASTVLRVDSRVIQMARSWLVSKQSSDGRWVQLNWNNVEDDRATALLTSHVAKSLALSERSTTTSENLRRALDYLEKRSKEIDEPYLIASYSLASSLAGDKERARRANQRLGALAHGEADGSYWSLETNTPFYGWGLAGRIETTALVIQALTATQPQMDAERNDGQNLLARGLLFLLRKKDRYGVWYSTQATINVLDAILSQFQSSPKLAETTGNSLEVLVNGQPAPSISMPGNNKSIAPLITDVSSLIKKGANQIELRRKDRGAIASVQSVATYYVPWSANPTVETGRRQSGDAESLQFHVAFNQKEARVTQEITCNVKAERMAFRGYGMLLAEIGLPPGADVDRASLETAMKGSDWSINSYDVLPDRIVFYLWPRAGGTSFSFKFKPRMAMKAKAAASTLYDYYNPEARVVIPPGTFLVK